MKHTWAAHGVGCGSPTVALTARHMAITKLDQLGPRHKQAEV